MARLKLPAGLSISLAFLFAGQCALAGGRGALMLSTPGRPARFAGGFGGYGGFYFPGYIAPVLPPAGSYLPTNWWSGQGSGDDPRQEGYNPSSGYSWDSVGALLLSTNPPDARVILDGTNVGAASELGPIQFPMGEHTIRIEAPGHAPSETTLKVERPGVQQLKIVLGRAAPEAGATTAQSASKAQPLAR